MPREWYGASESTPRWLQDPPLPEIEPPADPMYEIRSRIVRTIDGQWDATQTEWVGGDFFTSMRIAAWSRPPGNPDWPWCLLVYRRAWHDGKVTGSQIHWTATWCVFDPKALRPVRKTESANPVLSKFLEKVGSWPRFCPPIQDRPLDDR